MRSHPISSPLGRAGNGRLQTLANDGPRDATVADLTLNAPQLGCREAASCSSIGLACEFVTGQLPDEVRVIPAAINRRAGRLDV